MSLATARKSLRSVFSNFGLIVATALIHEVISEKVAGSRGRSTLEEVPYHTARRGVLAFAKETATDEDKAFEAPKATATDKKVVRDILKEYGPGGILQCLSELYTHSKALKDATSAHDTAMERLADRRSKFFPSPKAQELKLVTLVPERAEK